RRTAFEQIRRRVPRAVPLDRVVLDRFGLIGGEALDLVLGAKLEVRRVVALVELLALVAAERVDGPPALHRRPSVDLPRPAHQMLMFVGREELVGTLIAAAESDPAVPGPDRDIRDAVLGPGDIFVVRELAIEQVELALHP